MTFKMARHYFYLLLAMLALTSCSPNTHYGQQQSFKSWLADFKHEALTEGISQQVVDSAFANIKKPSKEVLARDHAQPERTKIFSQYMDGFLRQSKIDAAEEQWESHAEILEKVQQTYGVPIPIMLALWQTESAFGQHQGNFSVIESLATLAYDGRRSAFFRKELLAALQIVQQENIDPHVLTGSWAGAMGQVQFMPSSFLSLAVDFDGDGKKDIWNNDADALASMANYLRSRGWDDTMGWGMHVLLPQGADYTAWVENKQKYTLKQWQKLGATRADGKKLPSATYEARLVMPDSDPNNAYLVTSNYDVIMDWNHSVYFATGICLLADAIASSH